MVLIPRRHFQKIDSLFVGLELLFQYLLPFSFFFFLFTLLSPPHQKKLFFQLLEKKKNVALSIQSSPGTGPNPIAEDNLCSWSKMSEKIVEFIFCFNIYSFNVSSTTLGIQSFLFFSISSYAPPLPHLTHSPVARVFFFFSND